MTFWIPPCGGKPDIWGYFQIPATDETWNDKGQPWHDGDTPWGYAATISCDTGNAYPVPMRASVADDGPGFKLMMIGTVGVRNAHGGLFENEPRNARCVLAMRVPPTRAATTSLHGLGGHDWSPSTDAHGIPTMLIVFTGTVT